MKNKEQLLAEKYAKLLLSFGVALKPGEKLLLELPIEQRNFGKIVSECAYSIGAAEVQVVYHDIEQELRYLASFDIADKITVPKTLSAQMSTCLSNGGVSLFLASPHPLREMKLSQETQRRLSDYRNSLRNIVRKEIRENRIKWCYASVPNGDWGKALYPDLEVEDAEKKLWETLLEMCMVKIDNDPLSDWITYYDRLNQKAVALNQLDLRTIHFKSGIGTDIVVGVDRDCVWEGGLSKETYTNDYWQPNIPSYEVSTTADRRFAEGVVIASRPLNMNGGIVDGFGFTFKNGQVTDWFAKKGASLLEQALQTDEGSTYLGEVAFVECDTPISQTGQIFLNTLFDENAACHLALGFGFPGNIRGIDPRDEQAARAHGVNYSAQHIDFMFGTDDLWADGQLSDGQIIPIMRNGKFVL